MEVMVLSLRQPWAELVVNGQKTIELRTWKTKYRGTFYIHASLNTDKEKCEELGIKLEDLVTGAIIGKCNLYSIKRYEDAEELYEDSKKHYAPDYKLPCYGFLLKEAERIKPIKHKGRLGLRKTII